MGLLSLFTSGKGDGGDWSLLIKEVARLEQLGMDELAVSVQLAGRSLRIRGKVSEHGIDEAGQLVGLALEMPKVRAAISEGWSLVGDYAFVNLSPDGRSAVSAGKAALGEIVEIRCVVGAGSDLFPGVQVSKDGDEGARVAVPLIDLNEGEILERETPPGVPLSTKET